MLEKEIRAVTYRHRDQTASILLRSSEEDRAAVGDMLLALSEALETAAEDASVRAILITGEGNVFLRCSFEKGLCTADAGVLAAYRRYEAAWDAVKIPVVLAINGDCVSLGMDLLLRADLAIAAETARFGYDDIGAGIFPAVSMAQAMKVLPKKKLLFYLYTGTLFGTQSAKEDGLVNAVAGADELMQTAECWVQRLAGMPQQIIRFGREAYNTMSALPKSEMSAYGASIQGQIMAIQDTLNQNKAEKKR